LPEIEQGASVDELGELASWFETPQTRGSSP
jgi:hypothetical protein